MKFVQPTVGVYVPNHLVSCACLLDLGKVFMKDFLTFFFFLLNAVYSSWEPENICVGRMSCEDFPTVRTVWLSLHVHIV